MSFPRTHSTPARAASAALFDAKIAEMRAEKARDPEAYAAKVARQNADADRIRQRTKALR